MFAGTKLERETLAALRGAIRLPRPALAVIDACATVPQAIARLQEAGLPQPAGTLMAHALPPREAVWWACMCADATAPDDPAEADAKARTWAEIWVRTQEDDACFTAMEAARHAGMRSPEAFAAAAAYFSGVSMVPAPAERLKPAPRAAGDLVAGAVAMAAARQDPRRFRQRLDQFLQSGWDIADGGAGRMSPPAHPTAQAEAA